MKRDFRFTSLPSSPLHLVPLTVQPIDTTYTESFNPKDDRFCGRKWGKEKESVGNFQSSKNQNHTMQVCRWCVSTQSPGSHSESFKFFKFVGSVSHHAQCRLNRSLNGWALGLFRQLERGENLVRPRTGRLKDLRKIQGRT